MKKFTYTALLILGLGLIVAALVYHVPLLPAVAISSIGGCLTGVAIWGLRTKGGAT